MGVRWRLGPKIGLHLESAGDLNADNTRSYENILLFFRSVWIVKSDQLREGTVLSEDEFLEIGPCCYCTSRKGLVTISNRFPQLTHCRKEVLKLILSDVDASLMIPSWIIRVATEFFFRGSVVVGKMSWASFKQSSSSRMQHSHRKVTCGQKFSSETNKD